MEVRGVRVGRKKRHPTEGEEQENGRKMLRKKKTHQMHTGFSGVGEQPVGRRGCN
jgi:hypothetical protein